MGVVKEYFYIFVLHHMISILQLGIILILGSVKSCVFFTKLIPLSPGSLGWVLLGVSSSPGQRYTGL